ncbi:MAG: hypothetical protein L6R38_000522 [Xanthoria sp. 2 TBL-2021]|nr:MAG: hypothetical protein L6R38_000522 [Xanthoria sp. 2 TBL-2021]
MSAPNDYDRTDDNYRLPPAQYRSDRSDRSARFYDDRKQRSSSQDRYRRSPSPPRRQASPHDRHRLSRDENGATGGYSGLRNYDSRPPREEHRGFGDYRRGRMPSPNARRRGYVDRDNEGYRSPTYDSRSRSRSRSPQRRDRSPHFGAPPSREVILEGIPLDILEEDVRHHLPIYTTFKP